LAIPVIDLFAGPGGLGEGFSALTTEAGSRAFRLALSVEKDEVACRTLRLRAISRQLKSNGASGLYFSLLRGEISRQEFDLHPLVKHVSDEATAEVMNAELGHADPSALDARIRKALGHAADWVLIGGPPCQAYSLPGRSRRTNDATFESDEKHFLYREYLRIIRSHVPPVFIMENVKGLLSSRHAGSRMFDRILRDLSSPSAHLEYEIRSLVVKDAGFGLKPEDFIIESERYGVPQRRHRLILFGVRSDLSFRDHQLLEPARQKVGVSEVLSGMPAIRSRLSRIPDSPEAWHAVVEGAAAALRGWGHPAERRVAAAMKAAARAASATSGTGGSFVSSAATARGMSASLKHWILDPQLGGVIQHEAKSHMSGDLARYLFAACFAQELGVSPKLADFPAALLPDHANAINTAGGLIPFSDRFRVQVACEPGSTVVSHIAKDGHYYIHCDPAQCRSLSVREAARIQTFPDDYFFEGNKTQQYGQVGNAVPPLLATQIARSVGGLLGNADSHATKHRSAKETRAVA